MSDNLCPYPEMKRTRLPWLLTIPAHWEIRRNGRLFGIRKETGFPQLPVLEVSLHTGVRVRNFEDGTRKQQMADRSKYQRALQGDLAYNMMRMWQGAVGIVPTDGLVIPAYVVVRPYPETVARYYAYLFRTAAYMREVDTYSRGIVPDRNRLYWESFKQMPSVFPPADEQRLTVRFLDFHGSLTAQAIAAKQRAIRLLQEQKRTVIHHAITRGVKIGVTVKRSGISWIGDMPEHWQIAALRHRYHQCLGKMLDTKRIRGEHLVPYLRNTDVQWDRIRTVDLPTMDISPTEYDRYLVKKGDLLVCEGGEVGRAAIWDGVLEICGFQKALHRLRPRDKRKDCPRFMMYVLLLASLSGAFADGHESTISHLTGEKLRQHRLPFPERAEQSAIVAHLDAAFADVDRATFNLEYQIALLHEFRMRLIADVVTGKLDVRAAAASLPEAEGQPESLDEFQGVHERGIEDVEDPDLEEAAA
jgi:type I restriction enzyme S subunit